MDSLANIQLTDDYCYAMPLTYCQIRCHSQVVINWSGTSMILHVIYNYIFFFLMWKKVTLKVVLQIRIIEFLLFKRFPFFLIWQRWNINKNENKTNKLKSEKNIYITFIFNINFKHSYQFGTSRLVLWTAVSVYYSPTFSSFDINTTFKDMYICIYTNTQYLL